MTKDSVYLTPKDRARLYGISDTINQSIEEKFGLQIPFDVYLQDPLVESFDPELGLNEAFFIRWEPNLSDGPTSSRFKVIDYDGTTEVQTPPAKWDEASQRFVYEDRPLDKSRFDEFQFHQVNVWAILQRALDFYEGPWGLGRRIPWGFEGNRLIVRPHAGERKNAAYNRSEKALKFYYSTNDQGQIIYTCLSTDIINHEFGHAILDGIRPHYLTSKALETEAFHEFLCDITAILIILRNNAFRKRLAEKYKDLDEADPLAYIAEQFAESFRKKPYLRNANSRKKLEPAVIEGGFYELSEVLTSAIFQILKGVASYFRDVRKRSHKQAFYYTADIMQRMVLQALDLLPPAEVTFRDYALAMLQAEKLSNPNDPHKVYEIMLDVFEERLILTKEEIDEIRVIRDSTHLYERPYWIVNPRMDKISKSRVEAYHFLNNNRRVLYIPKDQDLVISDVYESQKFGPQVTRLPKQIVIVYTWREEIALEPAGDDATSKMVEMICGGTLVFDEYSNLQYWSRNPGIELAEEGPYYQPGSIRFEKWNDELKDGEARKARFIADELSNAALDQPRVEKDL